MCTAWEIRIHYISFIELKSSTVAKKTVHKISDYYITFDSLF